jgi:hypothetical protein
VRLLLARKGNEDLSEMKSRSTASVPPRTAALAIICLCTAAALTGRAQTPSLTIANPTPGPADNFGRTVAVVGNSVLVGDQLDATVTQFAGAAFLFGSNGTLMRTFLNPAPANGYFFGWSIAAVGNDKVLIGAPLASPPPAGHPGAAYLYHTNGTLMRTFLRPTTQAGARFGIAVAALGTDRVVIGADGDDRAGTDAGAAYLFSTNGALLATFTNSTPVDLEFFGQALAALGSDRVLIGAPGFDAHPGSALLFNTNGTLLTRFNNPVPQSGGSFGRAVTALGVDKIAIGAPQANINAGGAGVVYLFTTNGLLFPALLNPEATQDDSFGLSLTPVGTDKLLIGSFNQAAGQNIGAAYLLSTNGTVLMKIGNPSTNSHSFAAAMAAITTDRVLIGGPYTPPGGAAYVFDLRRSLDISKTPTNAVVVSWPSPWTGWTLQQNNNLNTTGWGPAPEPITDDGTNKFTITNPAGPTRFYRLARP